MNKFKNFLSCISIVGLMAVIMGCSATELKADNAKDNYARPGFVTLMEDGRLWVFEEDSKDLKKYQEHGELAKHIIRPGAGPDRLTLKAPDTETAEAYMLAKPGFATRVEDGRLWVFRAGSDEFKKYQEHGELAKHVIRPGAGPNRMTLKSPDVETIDAYMSAK